MKKEMKYFLLILITILLISCGRKVTSEEAEEKIAQHMYERYGEEFEVGYAMIDGYTKGDRDVTWYEARVTPIRYIGTPKYTDSYYRAVGTVMVKKKMFREEFGITRDTYSNVMLKESANEFYGKKLKELFGENYLSVLEVTGSYSDKSKNFEGSVKLTKEKGDRLYISGGIYIFGRVENDEDREWYRKQIYEFIQFMKETGTFEYVDLDIEIIDIRRLYDGFNNSDKIKKMLIDNRKSWENNEISAKDSDNKRKEILNTLNVLTKNEIIDNISKINRSTINESPFKWSYYTVLLYSKIYSPKYLLNSHLDKEKKKEYNKITDIEFDMGGYY